MLQFHYCKNIGCIFRFSSCILFKTDLSTWNIRQDYQQPRLKSSLRKIFVSKYNLTLGRVACFSYLLLDDNLLIVYGFFRFTDNDKEHTGQQRMPTPPWHLILPLIFVKVRVCPVTVLYFSFGVWFWTLFVNTTFHVSKLATIWFNI